MIASPPGKFVMKSLDFTLEIDAAFNPPLYIGSGVGF